MLRRCPHSLLRTRALTSFLRHESTLAASTTSNTHFDSSLPPVSISPDKVVYRGPLTNTFRRLKIFSLSSLSLCTTMVPLMFAIETNLPVTARAFLATTAVSTSAVSTSLIGWAGRSYVTKLSVTKNPETDRVQEIEATTLTLRLKPRITRIYDPTFVVRSSRPFAKWELADLVVIPPDMQSANTSAGQEETVAETRDASGNILGRWIVRWGENGEGNCREEGSVMRHFNVHEELLPQIVAEDVAPGSET
ncbi:hypothetical protein MIND_00019000 [Mycena indigotica]|uniref:Uncharacterized protein n=1 Tax=Mycena indigotica TaxID=2126181 RepID=A0A8H6WHG4_9AGAR|nr:uncharacterized protein MIND_00019000 [Mycena indigotica]KAF7315048.1 hypothetical protein MIND_00019000 [Mycena indigotica]